MAFGSRELSLVQGLTVQKIIITAPDIDCVGGGNFHLYHEIGHYRMGHVRETKSKTVSRPTSTTASTATASSTGSDSNDDGGGDDGGGEDGGGGDDDDPSDIALSPPVVYHVVSLPPFFSCMLLAGTAWLFRDCYLAAIPLIGLCALCVFPKTLQLLKAEVSSRGAKFEMRGKKED